MKLVQVKSLPQTAEPEGEPIKFGNHSSSQGFRDRDDRYYELVTHADGHIQVFLLKH